MSLSGQIGQDWAGNLNWGGGVYFEHETSSAQNDDDTSGRVSAIMCPQFLRLKELRCYIKAKKKYKTYSKFLRLSQNLLPNSLLIYMFCTIREPKSVLPVLHVKTKTNAGSQLVQKT